MEYGAGRQRGNAQTLWRECSIVAEAQDLAHRVTCRSIPRGHAFRGMLFRERIAEMRERYTNLAELLAELPLCEIYQEQYGPLCCDAMADLADPTRCTAMDEALSVLERAASAAAIQKYRLWRLGIYD